MITFYDFFIQALTWEIAFWVFALGYPFIRGSRSWFLIIAMVLVTALIVGVEILKMQSMLHVKEAYDQLWERRKNPIVYQAVKEVTDHFANEPHHRRPRQFALKINLFAGLLFIVINPVLTPIYLLNIFNAYHEAIFDFDEPEKKEKKQEDWLTELQSTRWQNLIGALNPGH